MDIKQMMARRDAQKGFTLVEIAIVLVIIGLLLGGVLKGQELIENAKVKSIGKDFENMSAAYYSYQDRKNVYPDASSDDAFWYVLKNEGFISGTYTSASDTDGPTHAFDGSYFAVQAAATPVVLKDGKNYICANNIAADVAQNLDVKYDDGVANTGSWIAVADATPPEDASPTASAADYAVIDAAGESVALCREL